jgi:hypothetical protein
VSVMELETGCRLLLLLHRRGMQGRAYTLFAPASHEFCAAHASTPAIANGAMPLGQTCQSRQLSTAATWRKGG